MVVMQACSRQPSRTVPLDPAEIRSAIDFTDDTAILESITNQCWKLGVPVLPLDDPGTFHGACFREEGRNVIVLKQRPRPNLVGLLIFCTNSGTRGRSPKLWKEPCWKRMKCPRNAASPLRKLQLIDSLLRYCLMEEPKNLQKCACQKPVGTFAG